MSSKLMVGLVSGAAASALTAVYMVAGPAGVRDVLRPAVDIPAEAGGLVLDKVPVQRMVGPAPTAPAAPATTQPLPTERRSEP